MVRVALLICCVSLRLAGSDSARTLADFDGPSPLEGWTFAGDRGFSGAGSSLNRGPGHSGQGAVVAYQFPCSATGGCWGSVAATWTPVQPLPTKHRAAISLWIRALPEVKLALLVRDKNEGVRRYPFEAVTLEHPAGEWRQVVVPLAAKSTGYWDDDHNGAPQGRILSIAIQVEPRFPQGLRGSLSFDDLRLLDSPDQTFDLRPDLPLSPPPAGSSKLVPRLGVNVHRLEDESMAAQVHDGGFSFVRADLLWRQVEHNGRFRFFPYDRLLASLETKSLGALWILDYGHPQHGGNVPPTRADVEAFAHYAAAVASHFKGHSVRYEIWNEPDTDRFWPPRPNPREYAALLREAVAAIHQADPSAKVSSGGLSGIDLPFLAATSSAGGTAGIDAAAVHPYRRLAPETLAAEVPVLRDFLTRAIGRSVEIWDTEWGYASYDYFSQNLRGDGHSEPGRHRQAVLTARELLTVWSLGIPLAVWYDLRDDGDDPKSPEHNYGLFDSKNVEKPAMKAVRYLASIAANRTFTGMVREVPDGVHVMRLEGGDGAVFVIWNDQPDGRVTARFPKDAQASATNLTGGPLKLKGPQIDLAEVEGPVYVRFEK